MKRSRPAASRAQALPGGGKLMAAVVALALLLASGQAVRAQPSDGPVQGRPAVLGPRALTFDYAQQNSVTTGVDGDAQLVFVAEPLSQRVVVLDRFLGTEVAQVPAPPGGFLLPFSLRVGRPGHLVVLDSGGFPNPSVPSVARVYDYSYQWASLTRTFTASLVRSVSFAGLPVVFAEDVEVTPAGLEVVAESVIGALWVIQTDGTIRPGVFPSGGGSIPSLGPCSLPPVTIAGIPFGTAGDFAPGVVSLAARGGQLYFGSTCTGGLARIPLASLVDSTRSPAQRAQDIVTVSPRPAGTVESFEGLAVNRFNPQDAAIYAADSFHLRVLRIDPLSGAREVLASDPLLFNFPVKLQFLPPVAGVSPLAVASHQEYRLAAINADLSTDLAQPPWIVTKVLVLEDDHSGASREMPQALSRAGRP